MEIVIVAIVGLLAGGIVNRLADTLPDRRPLWQPVAVTACGQLPELGGFCALPVWLRRRGRCPANGAALPLRPPLVELALIVLLPLLWLQHRALTPTFILHGLYLVILVLISVVDSEHRRILNAISYPAMGLAVLGALWSGRAALVASLLGGVFAFLFFGGLFIVGDLLLRLSGRGGGGPALGLGDVKLAGFIGLAIGWPGVLPALVVGIVLGGLAALLTLARQIRRRAYRVFGSALPYGPTLAAGAVAFLLWSDALLTLWTP